ncbi:MAG: histidine kinase, partial [Myxococcales bacterium]|nr:histidine kinase [Myxococcales bacterium]
DVTELRKADQVRRDFVANVSHELRTPVAATLGYLDLVLADRDRLPPEVVPLLETADRNARRLRDLFEDLLRLHRIEVRRRELPLRSHRLHPILVEATGTARDKATMRGQSFELDCPEDLMARVNPEALSAMVGNLASNASSYTLEGGHVRVVARPEGDRVRIDVIDDGIGIAERHHERVFERFYRVDDARSRKAGGTGLGLAIVKHYALASRCQLSLVSQEGKGSTFTLHLPT